MTIARGVARNFLQRGQNRESGGTEVPQRGIHYRGRAPKIRDEALRSEAEDIYANNN